MNHSALWLSIVAITTACGQSPIDDGDRQVTTRGTGGSGDSGGSGGSGSTGGYGSTGGSGGSGSTGSGGSYATGGSSGAGGSRNADASSDTPPRVADAGPDVGVDAPALCSPTFGDCTNASDCTCGQ